MESMTGYAFYEKSCDQFTFSVELKSLNNKYLETYVNLPKILKRNENEIQKKLKDTFTRGKLELFIDIYDWVETKPVSINDDLIQKYYAALKKIGISLRIDTPVTLDTVLALDGIVHRDRSQISRNTQREIERAVALVIKKTAGMRMAEGRSIGTDIMKSVSEIKKRAGMISKLSAQVAVNKKEQLKKRLESIAGKSIDDARLYTELALIADRLDINEELVRLGDHIKKFGQTVKESGQIGRKLDFLAQEMFREVNTISSKSNSSEISHHVVEMKNYIDKIREHCRNII